MTQAFVFVAITGVIAALTWLKCRGAARAEGAKEYFLAGGGLPWIYVAARSR